MNRLALNICQGLSTAKKKQPETNPNACPLKSQKDQMFCCISEVVSKAIRNALDKENPYLRTTLVHYLT